jgi:hypothetical protein
MPDDFDAAAPQPARHVAAHLAESDQADLHVALSASVFAH